MLRHAVSKSARQLQSAFITRRSYAAAKGKGSKRALTKQQLEGNKAKRGGSAAAPPSGTKAPPTTSASAASAPPPPAAGGGSGGGGDSTPLLMGVGLLAAGGGALYYFQSQPEAETPKTPTPEPVKEEEAPKKKKKAKKSKAKKEEAAPVVEKVTEDAVRAAEEEKPKSVRDSDGANRVLQIDVPEGTRVAPEAEPESHPEGGNRVTMESFGKPAKEEAPVATVKDSIKELQLSIEIETSEVMKRANQEVMRSFDESLFEGLDEMSAGQLKARVMQLATEMKERTRWEALRLKEFLAMKEKETADKYLDVLQKQRLEFEGILQRRLLEQEHEMTTQTNSNLQKKDSDVKEMIDTAIATLGEEHANEKTAMMERANQEIKSQYEQKFSQELEAFKVNAMNEMERKVQSLEALNKKLKDLEDALASSQNYHEGSLQAHRLSAAALALAEKMESNKGAGAELNALKSVAGRDNVIAAALSSVPGSITKGVPTLSELQARFDAVAGKTRQAAMVPAGQSGLEGQLAGMLFATLKFPPKADDPPPEDGSAVADYILVRAKKHVQFGELEKAVEQLEKLDGQAAFTVQGWKKDATDRVVVEQALKVIKMECALLNEAMSKTP